MSIKQRLRNPFYAIAMLLGLVFTVTACADVVLMMKSGRAGALPHRGEPGYALMDLLDKHGTEILAGELAGLGLCTVAAIRLDHVRDRREFARRQREAGEDHVPDRRA
jgi:hypothetical protein